MSEAHLVLTVTQLTRQVRMLLEEGIGMVRVEGEISNHRRQASGHQYFTLKDEGAQVSCVMFRGRSGGGGLGQASLGDGMQVEVWGMLTVYEARGQYQINVQSVQPRGEGLLQARFEALKRKLDAEGMFDAGRKQALPAFPMRIGLVTSPTGAAVKDMLSVLGRRAPWIEILLHPVRVQGLGAAEEIAAAIGELNAWRENGLPRVDLIIAGRGGGSLEDLWAFNEEIVARAIAASEIPIVSAVGHEIDFTIADFAADLRAPTPSAAAELVAPDREALIERMGELRTRMDRRVRERVTSARRELEWMSGSALHREPARVVGELRQQIDSASDGLRNRMKLALEGARALLRERSAQLAAYRPAEAFARFRAELTSCTRILEERTARALAEHRMRLAGLGQQVRLLGPEATLARGFSLTMDEAGALVRSAAAVTEGMGLRTRWADGEVRSVVQGTAGALVAKEPAGPDPPGRGRRSRGG